jgi:hypothetical protein
VSARGGQAPSGTARHGHGLPFISNHSDSDSESACQHTHTIRAEAEVPIVDLHVSYTIYDQKYTEYNVTV